MSTMRKWMKSGTPWVWLNAAAVSIALVLVVGLIGLLAVRGMGHFWPSTVYEFQYRPPGGEEAVAVIGEIYDREVVPADRLSDSEYRLAPGVTEVERLLIKTGNRDVLGLDFRWLVANNIDAVTVPAQVMVMERREWGNLYGHLRAIKENGRVIAEGEAALPVLKERLARAVELYRQARAVERGEIGDINYRIERLRLQRRGLELDGVTDPAAFADIEAETAALHARFETAQRELVELYRQAERDAAVMELMDGRTVDVPLAKVLQVHMPNAMSTVGKLGFYFQRLWQFVSDEPREANTEGGVFPAIFGTVAMVLLMSVLVTPLGVIAAIYMSEYAKKGPLTRLIRISVINLAGVPSIVYGVFGLGFFVYFLGGSIDRLFYPEALPAPTFGTGGLLWASLTLALLTLPVVIVSTEEGLARIPRAIREGSLALGATKAETLWRTVIPMASPAIMTGLILAVARAAGEVAPLMLVGVVKLAPSLPFDLNAPFLHADRKFMHLGFHIYDVGFQSPNVEAARPLVYATALLLVAIIVLLNLAAIHIRNRLRERYKALEA